MIKFFTENFETGKIETITMDGGTMNDYNILLNHYSHFAGVNFNEDIKPTRFAADGADRTFTAYIPEQLNIEVRYFEQA